MANNKMKELLEEVVSKGKKKFVSDDGVSEVATPEMDTSEPDTDLDQEGEGKSATEKNKNDAASKKTMGSKLKESSKEDDMDDEDSDDDADDLDEEYELDEELALALEEFDALEEGRMSVAKSADAIKYGKIVSNARSKLHQMAKRRAGGQRQNKTRDNEQSIKAELNDALAKYKAAMAKAHPKNKSVLNNSFEAKDFNISEDLDAMFGADNNLSENFKSNVSTIYEAALIAKANEISEQVTTELTEAFEVAKQEFADELKEEYNNKVEDLVEQIDNYLDKVINEWKEENTVELQSQFKAEISESFMSKLKDLFEDHYIDLPEEKINVFESIEERNAELEAKLEREIARNIELKEELEFNTKTVIFNELSESLTDTQKDKFSLLSETVVFTGEDSYKEKLEEIRSAYFTRKAATKFDLVDDEDPIDLVEEVRTPDNRDETVVQIAESMSKFFGGTRR